jgi:hypothetical protein
MEIIESYKLTYSFFNLIFMSVNFDKIENLKYFLITNIT